MPTAPRKYSRSSSGVGGVIEGCSTTSQPCWRRVLTTTFPFWQSATGVTTIRSGNGVLLWLGGRSDDLVLILILILILIEIVIERSSGQIRITIRVLC